MKMGKGDDMKYPITATLSLPPIEAGESAASVGALRFLKEQGFDGADLSTYFLDLSDWRRTYEAVAAARPIWHRPAQRILQK